MLCQSPVAEGRVQPHAKQDVGHPAKFRVALLNVGTLIKKEHKVVETLSRRRIDICSLQETRLTGGVEANQSCVISGKDSKYKLFFCGNKQGLGGVGILLAEKWIDKVIKVNHFSDKIMLLKLAIVS